MFPTMFIPEKAVISFKVTMHCIGSPFAISFRDNEVREEVSELD